MPFMYGPAPIRRTLQYLGKGKLVFLERVKIMSLNYNTAGRMREAHKGMQDFVFWDLPQVIHKNPQVQVVQFKNITPSPFIRCWLDGGREVIMDTDSKSNIEIMDLLIKTLGKSQAVLSKEALMLQKKETEANFGREYPKWCICEVETQVPCPRLVKLPDSMRGKCIHKAMLEK